MADLGFLWMLDLSVAGELRVNSSSNGVEVRHVKIWGLSCLRILGRMREVAIIIQHSQNVKENCLEPPMVSSKFSHLPTEAERLLVHLENALPCGSASFDTCSARSSWRLRVSIMMLLNLLTSHVRHMCI